MLNISDSSVLMYTTHLFFPLVLVYYSGLEIYDFFIPLTGRTGHFINPDIVIGALTALMVVTVAIFIVRYWIEMCG